MQPISSPKTFTSHRSHSVSALLCWGIVWVALLWMGTPGAEASSKNAAISELLELTESFPDTFMAFAMLAMEKDDGEFPVEVIEERSIQETLEEFKEKRVLPIIAKHFSEEEILALVEFFGTPAGQKLLEELPDIMSETQDAGKQWREGVVQSALEQEEDSARRNRANKLRSEVVIGKDELDSVGNSEEEWFAFDTPPEAIHVEPADYPESARQARAEGEVTLFVTIDTDGRVTDVDVHESDVVPELERAAINAAYKWRFEPAKQKETPVKVGILIPFRFSLD